MSVEDNKWTEEMIDSHFHEMKILLVDTCENFNKTDWFEKYRHLELDNVQAFDLMEDDVQRLKKSILLHDALATIPSERLLELFEEYGVPYEE